MTLNLPLALVSICFIFCTLFSHAQVMIEFGDAIGQSQERKAELKEVVLTTSYSDLLGLLRKKNEDDVPVFVRGGIEKAIRSVYAITELRMDPEVDFSIQVQRLWLDDQYPRGKRRASRLAIDFVFFVHDHSNGAEEYLFVTRHKAELISAISDSSETLRKALVSAVREALVDFDHQMASPSEEDSKQLRVKSIASKYHGDGLEPSTIEGLEGKTGVIETFEDLVKGEIKPNPDLKVKANTGGDAYKIRVKGLRYRYSHWGLVVDGLIYKNCIWGYQALYGEGPMTTYMLPEKYSQNGVSTGYFLGGYLGQAIAVGVVKSTYRRQGGDTSSVMLYDCVHELDMLTGSLNYVVTHPRRPVSTDYHFYHSSFSKSDSLKLTFNGEAIYLKHDEYAKISVMPNIYDEYLSIELNDGTWVENMILDFKSQESKHYTLWTRKNRLKVDHLSSSDFKSREKVKVRWTSD